MAALEILSFEDARANFPLDSRLRAEMEVNLEYPQHPGSSRLTAAEKENDHLI